MDFTGLNKSGLKELDNIEIDLDKMFKNTEKNQRYTQNLETKRVGKYTVHSFGYFIEL